MKINLDLEVGIETATVLSALETHIDLMADAVKLFPNCGYSKIAFSVANRIKLTLEQQLTVENLQKISKA